MVNIWGKVEETGIVRTENGGFYVNLSTAVVCKEAQRETDAKCKSTAALSTIAVSPAAECVHMHECRLAEDSRESTHT